MKFAVVAEQALRGHMEDRHVVHETPEGLFIGVYDGHSGAGAAEYAAQCLHGEFLARLREGGDAGTAFAQAYAEISRRLEQQDAGTTAVTCWLCAGRVVCANAGDARAIVVGQQGWRQLSVDHRVESAAERARVLAMGGRIQGVYVCRGDAGLMPTRTIGDPYFKPVGIIATPSVRDERLVPDDRFLIAACDGLWDNMSNSEAASCADECRDPEALVARLRDEVLIQRRGMDNLTIVVVAF